MEMNRIITVVSSFFNEEEVIEKYLFNLKFLSRNELKIKFILVNNGSTDATLKLLKKGIKNLDRVQIITNPEGSSYAEGIRKGISLAKTKHILIFPGDMQFSSLDTQKLLNYYAQQVIKNRRHINILSYRKRRFDGLFLSLRGTIWKYILNQVLLTHANHDPASQLRILCKCCLPNSQTKDFFWDIEVFFHLFLKKSISNTVDVNFYKREFGKSKLDEMPFRKELNALNRLRKMKNS
jgi:glycosyltransferase involved in cell wall biosynthesis